MYKTTLIILTSLFLTSFACNIGKINNMNTKNTDFDFASAWKKIDSLEQKGLYKSAMKIVETIYNGAEKFNVKDQKIKCLFYKGKYSNYLAEDNLESFEKILRKEIEKSKFPDKQIYQSILGEFYDKYLQTNYWKIKDRTETSDSLNEDIQTWSSKHFIEKSNDLFNNSIAEKGLKNISYSLYKEIFTKPKNTEKMRDNLYEILVSRALEHFKNDRNYLPKTTQLFNVDKSEYFDIPQDFINIKLISVNVNDPKYKTLFLFQQLEKHNLESKDYDELIDITLKRLEFVNGQYLKQDRNKLLLNSLDKLINKYPSQKSTSEVYYRKALIYKNMGNKENASHDSDLKWKIKDAREICLNAENKYPETYGASMCKSLRSQIDQKQLRVTAEKVNLPNENLLVKIEFQNLNKAFFKLAKISSEQFEKYKNKRDKQLKYLNGLDVLKKWEVELPDDGDYRNHEFETGLSPLDKGMFVLMVSNNSGFEQEKGLVIYQFLHVSNLSFWTKVERQGNYIFVVDRKTGKAVKNAIVELSYQEWDRNSRKNKRKLYLTKSTNSQGFIKYKPSNNYRNYNVKVSKGNDVLHIDENLYSDRIYENGESSAIQFFTDRAIYRPGQTVYYKGIFIHRNKNGEPEIFKNKSNIKIKFLDANNQKVSEQTVSTNEFGSLNGSFTIPQSGLTGTMRIKSSHTGNISFRVEEYKRPKFEVEFEDYLKTYKLGDKIQIIGNASSFSGFPLQNSKVVYTVKRRVYYPYYYGYYFRRPPSGGSIEIAHGESITDQKGKFLIPVELFAKDIDLDNYFPSFDFEVKADVIDMTGETHSATKHIRAGVTDVNIAMSLDDKVKEDEEMKIMISSTNHSGQKVDAKGKISIFKLEEPSRIFRNRYWSKPDTFILNRDDFYKQFPFYSYKNDADRNFWKIQNTAREIDFDTKSDEEYVLKLSAGEYKIILKFDDPSGKEIKLEKFTSVYSDKKNPDQTLLIVDTDKKEYKPTSEAKISWRSDIDKLNVYYTLWKRHYDVIGKQWLNLSGNDDLTIKILDEYRGGIVITNTFVYNNRFYNENKSISIPWSNKQLEFEYTSFRSKLYPGQDEEWQIKIKGEKSEQLIGEILAGMYDASLDKIYKQDWQKSIFYPLVSYRNNRSLGFGNSNPILRYGKIWYNNYNTRYFKEYRRINWFGFNVNSISLRGRRYRNIQYEVDGVRVMKEKKGVVYSTQSIPESAGAAPVVESRSANEMEVDESIRNTDTSEKIENADKNEGQLRTNLDETVFFKPDIITDKDGNFVLKFKMNDALTKWKFRMFAHTKDLKFGYSEKEIVTQKELMITPNNPRFVREGDKLEFKARIDNLTENALDGNAWVELFDAETMKPLESVFIKSQRKNSFSMDSKGSALVSWEMDFPKNVSNLLIYRFYAKAGDFSDAEEGFLPILTNQKLVTETMPLWVGGNQTKSFSFKSLKNSGEKELKNINFTIESTSHPIWLAIQSLPYLKNVKDENSISFANALFGNLLAKKITDDNPKIKRVFERWNNGKSKIDKDALLSNLGKNQELKNILLEETPWVLDAIDEEEQKRNIALLFNLNQVENDKKAFLRKLRELQNSDGGFPWFIHGRSSRYITQYIVELFGKMKHLKLYKNDREIQSFLNEAIDYVNRDVVIQYKKLLKLANEGKVDLEKNHLGSLQIHYMYAIQFYPNIEKNQDLQSAYDYYFGQAKKYWLNQPLYLKGMLALILHRDKETKISKEILRAADEQSIVSEELGMYWKSYHGYHWWQLPIETQALMIEAFSEVNDDAKTVDLLKVWLLKNKQTNRWETDKSTVSAIYSLLFDKDGALSETGLVKIYVNNKDVSKDLDKNDIQAGTGYYKKKWSGIEVKPEMSEVKIKNPNKDIAWGAVYWQYLQDLDKIETFEETPLKIQRTLYLVKNTDKGEKMTEIKESDILEPGDLVKVKIRLQVDREMEFVHLSDQRAATFEPLEQISKYQWQGGLGFYQNPRDTKMNFFIDFLPRGVFVLEYPLRVTQSGIFSNGIAELQSYYAPEFSSHSEGLKVEVK